uniref:Neuromedin U n=1 Tax=Nannospalax galili TaxID=1026970 RepID=A0A8C6WBB6_NANGA
MSRAAGRRPGLSAGHAATASLLPLLLLLLTCCARTCLGAPISPQRLRAEQELRLWNEIHTACSTFLSTDSQPQVILFGSVCNNFLFHYSKTPKLGNSNVVSSVVHPLLQLVPQLHERRMKRFKEEFQSPFAGRSRGYFLFRPRNGKRSTSFI